MRPGSSSASFLSQDRDRSLLRPQLSCHCKAGGCSKPVALPGFLAVERRDHGSIPRSRRHRDPNLEEPPTCFCSYGVRSPAFQDLPSYALKATTRQGPVSWLSKPYRCLCRSSPRQGLGRLCLQRRLYLSIYLSIYLSNNLSIYPSICLSIHPPKQLRHHPSVRPSIHHPSRAMPIF